jgi:hypothetical protein
MYIPGNREAATIQVKTNWAAVPAGGKGLFVNGSARVGWRLTVLGGRVAEVRWGSGRILARAGHHVVGVDTSPHMLALACEKLATAGPEVAARARLVQGDLRYSSSASFSTSRSWQSRPLPT